MPISMTDALSIQEVWEHFYEYKRSLALPKDLTVHLRGFIDRREYLSVCADIAEGRPFPLPERGVISKLGSEKKRVIYTYPEPHNTLLKLLTYLMLREYDGLFEKNLYSFRPGHTAKDAVRYLSRCGRGKYAYKADISSYFGSVDIDRLIPMLEEALCGDPKLLKFVKGLLTEPYVLERGRPVRDDKGIMAGTPLSAFYANLYLKDLDSRFVQLRVPYARYSDDIIVFADTEDELMRHREYIREFLAERGLDINPGKEQIFTPEEGWIFLGFVYRGGVTDIAPASLTKLRQKMRRKTRALKRWSDRGNADSVSAAKAFIRVFGRKMFGGLSDNELSWAHWYFPVINTDKSLKEIDRYAQECLRYLISGRRTKSRYGVRYEDMKKLGLKSLVNEFHRYKKQAMAKASDKENNDA